MRGTAVDRMREHGVTVTSGMRARGVGPRAGRNQGRWLWGARAKEVCGGSHEVDVVGALFGSAEEACVRLVGRVARARARAEQRSVGDDHDVSDGWGAGVGARARGGPGREKRGFGRAKRTRAGCAVCFCVIVIQDAGLGCGGGERKGGGRKAGSVDGRPMNVAGTATRAGGAKLYVASRATPPPRAASSAAALRARGEEG